ncbi:MAG TPA: DUF6438 domain-containing protein [Allosphingosinicella sp.]|jgi:hypothetical protein|nr:DUF6438 domain-containing protein [Allosphingosinicella sp.]
MRKRVPYAVGPALAGLAAACAHAAADAPPARIGFSRDAMTAARLSGRDMVVVRTRRQAAMESVVVEVAVDRKGRVIAASAARDENEFGPAEAAAAVAAVRGWRFRPFTYRGKAVIAVGKVEVRYRPVEQWADIRARFPGVDYGKLAITLERFGCYGSCPVYRVRIEGDGRVVFQTLEPLGDPLVGLRGGFDRHNVLAPGRHEGRIARAEVEALVDRFRSARFFGLRKAYRAPVTDSASFVVTFETGRRRKRVVDYVGKTVGMPEAVTRLEDEIDRVAETARWVAGDPGTGAALAAEGFDFASPAADDLLYRAVASAPESTLLDLLGRGVDLERRHAIGAAPERPLGLILLEKAIRLGRPAFFAELARRGWLERAPRAMLESAFAETAAGFDPGIAATLVASGVAPDARDADGKSALIGALSSYASYWTRSPAEVQRMASALLRLGVPVDAAGKDGKTALFHARTPEMAALLLAAGASVSHRSAEGLSAPFFVHDDRTALVLLEAGADPRGSDARGNSLRRLAGIRGMPGTIAWLDSHGIP